MRVRLGTPNPLLDPDAVDEINQNNVRDLQTTINKTGVAKTLYIQNSTSTNFTSTTYTQLLNMAGVVTSSGGFFDISFKTSYTSPGGNDGTIQLLIDGQVMDGTSLTASAGSITSSATLRFSGPLGAGRHNISVQCVVQGGTWNFNLKAGTYTTLQAVETVL